MYIYIYIYIIVAIFYPFSQFCEISISLLSLQKQPNTAPNLFQRGVEYGKYARFTSPSHRRCTLKGFQPSNHQKVTLNSHLSHIAIYIYIYIYIHIYIYIYICIYTPAASTRACTSWTGRR